jgi:ATP-dependent DNA ligase
MAVVQLITLPHHKANAEPIVYYLFDVLAFRGRDLRQLPLQQRRAFLDEALQNASEPLRLSATLDVTPNELIRAVKSQGLEGIIAKRVDGRYESGERSGAWVKFRVNKGQELVIGGYRIGKNYFDNLAVGYYDQTGKLIFIAKIKNGFTRDVKSQVFERLQVLETKVCPFNNLPETKTARRGEALRAEAMRNYRWVKPKLAAEVEFTDLTGADHLRHSRFVGLREDKDARQVHKES